MRLSYFINALDTYYKMLENGLIECTDNSEFVREKIEKLRKYMLENGDVDNVLKVEEDLKRILKQ